MGILDLFKVMNYRKLIVLWSLTVGLGVGAALAVLLPTKYASTAKVQVDSLQRNSLTGLIEPRVRVGEYLGQQAAVASSRTVALEVIDRLSADRFIVLSDFEEQWRRETGGELVAGNDLRLWAADQLLGDFAVTANEIGSTLELSFRAEDPAQAARVANAFASAYMSTVLDQKQRRSARRAASFSVETQALAQNVAEAQGELAAFREESGVMPLGNHKIEATELEYSALAERLALARADKAEAQSLLRQAEETPSGELISFPLPADAIAALQAQERLVIIAPIVARLGERYGPKYPEYAEALKEKATLEGDILRSIRDRADYAANRVAALEAQAAGLKSKVSGMQSTREKYDLLANKVDASQETFNLVTTRTLQEALQSRVDTLDVFLLARATPPADPATPPMWVIVLLGAFAGGTLGAAIAVFVELLEGRVRNPDAVLRSFRTKIIGEIDPPRSGRRRKSKNFDMRVAA